MEVLKVAAKSNPNSVAGALAGVIREQGMAEMQAIGAGAINQAIKAITIARGFVAPSGIDLVCVPAFVDVEIDGVEKTAIKLIVSPRSYSHGGRGRSELPRPETPTKSQSANGEGSTSD
jgi:stage V sporulation protein S